MKSMLHFSWTMMEAGAMKTAFSSACTRLCFPRATLYCLSLLEAHRSKGLVKENKSFHQKTTFENTVPMCSLGSRGETCSNQLTKCVRPKQNPTCKQEIYNFQGNTSVYF